MSREGRIGYSLPKLDVPETELESLLPGDYIRDEDAKLPEVSELDIMRHYTALSKRNHGVDSGFYPLGSCTMKYNPKLNEKLPGSQVFRYSSASGRGHGSGALELLYDLSEHLEEITGMDEVTLQPAAGAHGEWTYDDDPRLSRSAGRLRTDEGDCP